MGRLDMLGNWLRRKLPKIRRPLLFLMAAVCTLFGAGAASKYLLDAGVEQQAAERRETETAEPVDWSLLVENERVLNGRMTKLQAAWQVSDVLPETKAAERILLDKIGNFGEKMVRSLFYDGGEEYFRMLDTDYARRKGYSVSRESIQAYAETFSESMQGRCPDVSLQSARFIESNCVEAVFRFAHLLSGGESKSLPSKTEDPLAEVGNEIRAEAVYPPSAIYTMRFTVWIDKEGEIVGFIPCRMSNFLEQAEELGFCRFGGSCYSS